MRCSSYVLNGNHVPALVRELDGFNATSHSVRRTVAIIIKRILVELDIPMTYRLRSSIYTFMGWKKPKKGIGMFNRYTKGASAVTLA